MSLTPGPDGLPFSFYKATPFDPHRSVTVDKDQLANKRPVSSINTDDRIMDRAINMRLAPILPSLIHPSQTGFIPGRWIGTNETIQNAIDDDDQFPALIVSVKDSGIYLLES